MIGTVSVVLNLYGLRPPSRVFSTPVVPCSTIKFSVCILFVVFIHLLAISGYLSFNKFCTCGSLVMSHAPRLRTTRLTGYVTKCICHFIQNYCTSYVYSTRYLKVVDLVIEERKGFSRVLF